MMSADDMFKAMGYDHSFGFRGEIEWYQDDYDEISFNRKNKTICIGETIMVDMALLKAMVQKSKELGWLE
jgi:hypothetical protein